MLLAGPSIPLRAQATTLPATLPATVPSADARVERVLVVSIDGARPDVMLRADMPNIRDLLDQGSFSFWARTTEASITLPSHMSMLTGVPPEMHGIHWNNDRPIEEIIYSPHPTLFERGKAAGMTTALAAGKSKFIAFAKPGAIDWVEVPDAGSGYSDADVAERAAALIAEHQPEVMAVHFGGVDGAGHSAGWGSPRQVEALERADAALGVVLQALRDEGLYDDTLIIISADHGGSGKGHGRDDVRDRHIPWIAVGPGIRSNFDLTTYKELTINTEDTFATAANFLGLTPDPDITGKPILEILADFELLREVPTPPTTEPSYTPATQPTAATP